MTSAETGGDDARDADRGTPRQDIEYKRDHEEITELREPIVAALDRFWRHRAVQAPLAADLQQRVAKQSRRDADGVGHG